MDARARGTLFAFLSAVCFGTEAIFVKLSYAHGVTPLTVSVMRFTIAAAALSPWFLPHVLRHRLRRRTWLAMAIISVFLYVPVTLLIVSALQRVSASVAIICLYIYPTIATVLAVPVLGERLTAGKAIALIGSFAGVALVVGAPGTKPDLLGVGMAMLAAVINAFSVVAVKRELGDLPPLVATGGIIAVGAVVFAAIALVTGAGLPVPAAAIPQIISVGVIATAAALGFLYTGLSLIEASRVAIIATFEPVITAGLAAVFLAERLAVVQAVGGLLIVGSILAQQYPMRRPGAADNQSQPPGGSRG